MDVDGPWMVEKVGGGSATVNLFSMGTSGRSAEF